MTAVFDYREGTLPLVVSIPHAGTALPPGFEAKLTAAGAALPDTDWYVDRLYGVAGPMGATVIKANYARVVVDLNRPPDGASLYPGERETGICPTINFDGSALYRPGQEPGPADCTDRISRYWQPYHDRLAATLAALKARHGRVILWDAHSIRSGIPGLFAGRLPDFNIGTAGGASCSSTLAARLLAVAEAVPERTAVLNGRFKGGYITRHYGRPAAGVSAVQLELAQSTYMDEAPPHAWCEEKAQKTQEVICALLRLALEMA